MDVLSKAINMEIEGAEFYRNLAKNSKSNSLKVILNLLAEDEEKHEKTFRAWKNNKKVAMVESKTISEVDSIFQDVQKEDFIKAHSQLELYMKARDMEQQGIDYFTEQKENPENELNIEIIDKIIAEEKRHYKLLTNIIEFIATPDDWVESAEFGVRGEY